MPLVAGSKRPVCDAWQIVPSATQWADVGANFRGNIGVRCGAGWAVIDADDPAAIGNIKANLSGLGLRLPEVQTPSGNRHFYLKVRDAPEGFNWCRLPVNLGPGELRVGNAYVVAPCSEVRGRRYRFLSGDPEAVANLQPISWHDLGFLYKSATPVPDLALEELPIRLVRREMPMKAVVLLNLLRDAPKGQPVLDYPTRSEAEQAVICMLILAGWDFDEICQAFDEWQPGHYHEYPERHRLKYLARGYRKALRMLAGTPERQEIASLYHQALIRPWPGRAGDLKQMVFLALLAVGWQFSTWEINASQRVIAEHAAASQRMVTDVLKYLESDGLIERTGWDNLVHGITWRVNEDAEVLNSHNASPGIGTIHDIGITRDPGITELIHANPELWTTCRLGRPSQSVMVHLAVGGDDGLNVYELAERTGRDVSTVRRALTTLAKFDLAASDGGRPVRWRRGPWPLSEVTKELDVEGAARRRRQYHQKQRQAWRQWVSEHYTTEQAGNS
jgi:hypothetical protein